MLISVLTVFAVYLFALLGTCYRIIIPGQELLANPLRRGEPLEKDFIFNDFNYFCNG